MQCDVARSVFAYPIKLTISTNNTVTQILQKKLYCDFKLSLQSYQEKIRDNISCRWDFNNSTPNSECTCGNLSF